MNMRRSSRTINARIHRLSGQLEAIELMIQKKRDCTDILHQISAVRAGLENVAVIVLQKELQKMGAHRSIQTDDMDALLKSFIKST